MTLKRRVQKLQEKRGTVRVILRGHLKPELKRIPPRLGEAIFVVDDQAAER